LYDAYQDLIEGAKLSVTNSLATNEREKIVETRLSQDRPNNYVQCTSSKLIICCILGSRLMPYDNGLQYNHSFKLGQIPVKSRNVCSVRALSTEEQLNK